jgi:hypothetical protein
MRGHEKKGPVQLLYELGDLEARLISATKKTRSTFVYGGRLNKRVATRKENSDGREFFYSIMLMFC